MRRSLVIISVIVAIVVIAALSTGAVFLQSNRQDQSKFKPLTATADQFPAPSAAKKAFPDTKTNSPLEVTRGWNVTGSLTDACSAWGDAFRNWIGDSSATGSVTGDITPNVSCSYQAKKNGYDVNLLVAVYGTQSPQAVLTVKGP